jgi:hypothetical protein
MRATMLEQETKQMSVIFLNQPNKAKVHPLPKGSEMITFSVSDSLWIRAWMPDGYKNIHQEVKANDDDFHSTFCEVCPRNCCDFLSNYENDDGEVDWDNPDLKNHCSVYDEGYHGQTCPEGNEAEEDDVIDFRLSNMVFGIALNHRNTHYSKFYCDGDTAYLSAGKVGDDGNIHSTGTMMAANVFGGPDYPERICWGYNNTPKTLRGIVESYFETPFNNDLLPMKEFENNSRVSRYLANNGEFDLEENEKLLSTESPDALMLLDAAEDVSAFFQMLTAGFKSVPDAPHIMMIPLFESKIEKNGGSFSGYLTSPDELNKQWFVSHDGLIIGQV